MNESMRCAAFALAVTLWTGCGNNQPSKQSAANNPASSPTSAPQPAPNTAAPAAQKPSVPTAPKPADACGWIPVTDVEAIVGPLAEPPQRKDGCRYTMKVPDAVNAKRQEYLKLQEKLEKLGATPQRFPAGSIGNAPRDPKSYAFTINVDVNGNVAAELTSDTVTKRFAEELDLDPPPPGAKPRPIPPGWDNTGLAPYGFSGRVGHVQVSVDGQAPDVPRAPLEMLAASVRDHIADLPFAAENLYQVPRPQTDQDPCSLLTRDEAEAVLGKLLVEPYRASSYYPPLAHPQGQSCGYFTAGHHVFVITPTWSDGAKSFQLEKGISGVLARIAPPEAIVIKGPWEKSQISGTTGALMFLKADRLLEIHYLTSSAPRGGAIKLAATAMQRLAP
jgi:hypothetical protein